MNIKALSIRSAYVWYYLLAMGSLVGLRLHKNQALCVTPHHQFNVLLL